MAQRKTKINIPKLAGWLPLLILLLFGSSALAFDVGKYQVLEPSFLGDTKEISNFAQWSSIVFKTILNLLVSISVIQLAYGGIEYILSASAGGKNDGKDRVQSALVGLVVALASVLILKIINPDLISYPDFLK
jgi:L-asparagine transporter-like permease